MKPSPLFRFSSACFAALLCLALAGCANQRQARTPGSTKTVPSPDVVITDEDVRRKAEEYRASGVARDMATALRMAREFYWPQKQDPKGIDERLAEAREKTRTGGK